MNTEKLVIGLTGMPGSGKSLVVEAAKNFGYDVITMGDAVREETVKRGLELTPANVGKVMLELRKENGERIVAEKCIPKITKRNSSHIMVDGLRSYIEVETFQKSLANFVLIAVHSSPQTRFKRLSARGRSDDPKNWDDFRERDMRELNVGIGHAIALAEYVIINDTTKSALNKKALRVFKKAEAKWKK